MWFTPTESKLLFKRIVKVSMPDDQQLVFDLEDHSRVIWTAEGDCCSESWFENIQGLGFLKNGVVVEIKEKDIPEEVIDQLRATRQEEDALYGYTLKVATEYYSGEYNKATRFEVVDIEFRNSSNGYYGGMLGEEVTTWKEEED